MRFLSAPRSPLPRRARADVGCCRRLLIARRRVRHRCAASAGAWWLERSGRSRPGRRACRRGLPQPAAGIRARGRPRRGRGPRARQPRGDPRRARRRAAARRSSPSIPRPPRRGSRRLPGCARPRSSAGCPTRCFIASIERQPLAFWQHHGKLDADRPRRRSDAGRDLGRYSRARSCWSATTRPPRRRRSSTCWTASPSSRAHVAAAVRVGGRRWNVAFDNGVDGRAARRRRRRRLASAGRARAQRPHPRARHRAGRSAPARPRLVLRLPPETGAEAAAQEGHGQPGRAHDEAQPRAARRHRRRRRYRHHQDVLLHRARSTATKPRDRRHRPSGVARRTQRRRSSISRRRANRSSPPSTPPSRWPARRSTSVVVNLSGGFGASRLVKAEIDLERPRDQRQRHAPRARSGHRMKEPPTATVIHSDPGRLLHRRQPRHPRSARHVRPEARASTCTSVAADCRRAAQPRHLHRPLPSRVAALVVSPYAAGLGCPGRGRDQARRHRHRHGRRHHHDRRVLRRQLVFADSVPIGGDHVTNDIARGLSTPLAHAERMKTLYGAPSPRRPTSAR